MRSYRAGAGMGQRRGHSSPQKTTVSPPLPPEPGPLDVIVEPLDGFNEFTQEFGLAQPNAVVGIVARFSGDPTIDYIRHGGEDLEVVQFVKYAGSTQILAVIAIGSGLTVEEADLEVKFSGGNVGCGALRINEVASPSSGSSGWSGGAFFAGTTTPEMQVDGTGNGGPIKIAWGNVHHQALPFSSMLPPDTNVLWSGIVLSGNPYALDLSTSGAWNLDPGWAIDGTDFTHTGGSSVMMQPLLYPSITNMAIDVDLADGATILLGGFSDTGTLRSGATYRGPYTGTLYASLGVTSQQPAQIGLIANGDAVVSEIRAYVSGRVSTSYAFMDAGAATEGKVLRYAAKANAPSAFAAAEAYAAP